MDFTSRNMKLWKKYIVWISRNSASLSISPGCGRTEAMLCVTEVGDRTSASPPPHQAPRLRPLPRAPPPHRLGCPPPLLSRVTQNPKYNLDLRFHGLCQVHSLAKFAQTLEVTQCTWFPASSFSTELSRAVSFGMEFKSVALKPKFTFLFLPTTQLSLNNHGKALGRMVWVEKMGFKAIPTLHRQVLNVPESELVIFHWQHLKTINIYGNWRKIYKDIYRNHTGTKPKWGTGFLHSTYYLQCQGAGGCSPKTPARVRGGQEPAVFLDYTKIWPWTVRPKRPWCKKHSSGVF